MPRLTRSIDSSWVAARVFGHGGRVFGYGAVAVEQHGRNRVEGFGCRAQDFHLFGDGVHLGEIGLSGGGEFRKVCGSRKRGPGSSCGRSDYIRLLIVGNNTDAVIGSLSADWLFTSFPSVEFRKDLFPMIFFRRTIKCSEDEHDDFRPHADAEKCVASGKVQDLEERTPDDDGRAYAVSEVEKALAAFPPHYGFYL